MPISTTEVNISLGGTELLSQALEVYFLPVVINVNETGDYSKWVSAITGSFRGKLVPEAITITVTAGFSAV